MFLVVGKIYVKKLWAERYVCNCSCVFGHENLKCIVWRNDMENVVKDFEVLKMLLKYCAYAVLNNESLYDFLYNVHCFQLIVPTAE